MAQPAETDQMRIGGNSPGSPSRHACPHRVFSTQRITEPLRVIHRPSAHGPLPPQVIHLRSDRFCLKQPSHLTYGQCAAIHSGDKSVSGITNKSFESTEGNLLGSLSSVFRVASSVVVFLRPAQVASSLGLGLA